MPKHIAIYLPLAWQAFTATQRSAAIARRMARWASYSLTPKTRSAK
jgi:hypothetical protein